MKIGCRFQSAADFFQTHNIFIISYILRKVNGNIQSAINFCVLHKNQLYISYILPIEISEKTCYNINTEKEDSPMY